ncbi:MAG: hypothetical protein QXO19_03010 [Candidatus Aenigmatarchaeota archaeon]
MKNLLFIVLIIGVLISGCISESSISNCKSDKENVKCEITKEGIATITNTNLPSNAVLTSAKISPCEITGELWSCKEIDMWKIKDCEILSSSQPFKVKCQIESGAWMIKFNILKPSACPDPIDPSILRDCEETIRIYQKI